MGFSCWWTRTRGWSRWRAWGGTLRFWVFRIWERMSLWAWLKKAIWTVMGFWIRWSSAFWCSDWALTWWMSLGIGLKRLCKRSSLRDLEFDSHGIPFYMHNDVVALFFVSAQCFHFCCCLHCHLFRYWKENTKNITNKMTKWTFIWLPTYKGIFFFQIILVLKKRIQKVFNDVFMYIFILYNLGILLSLNIYNW